MELNCFIFLFLHSLENKKTSINIAMTLLLSHNFRIHYYLFNGMESIFYFIYKKRFIWAIVIVNENFLRGHSPSWRNMFFFFVCSFSISIVFNTLHLYKKGRLIYLLEFRVHLYFLHFCQTMLHYFSFY